MTLEDSAVTMPDQPANSNLKAGEFSEPPAKVPRLNGGQEGERSAGEMVSDPELLREEPELGDTVEHIKDEPKEGECGEADGGGEACY